MGLKSKGTIDFLDCTVNDLLCLGQKRSSRGFHKKKAQLIGPILKSMGMISSYQTMNGSDIDLLLCHSMAELGYNDIIDDCSCVKNDLISTILGMVEDGNDLTSDGEMIFLTDIGSKRSREFIGINYSFLIRKDCPQPKDKRDEATWVVVELSPLGENKLEEGNIEQIIRKSIGMDKNHPVFVPKATYHEDSGIVSLHLLDGYIFIQSGLPEVSYFKLEHTPYVSKVLSKVGSDGIRVLSVIPDRNISEMKDQISCLSVSDLSKGDTVIAVDGLYKGLDFIIMEIVGDRALVKSHGLRSIDIITIIPLRFLSSIK